MMKNLKGRKEICDTQVLMCTMFPTETMVEMPDTFPEGRKISLLAFWRIERAKASTALLKQIGFSGEPQGDE